MNHAATLARSNGMDQVVCVMNRLLVDGSDDNDNEHQHEERVKEKEKELRHAERELELTSAKIQAIRDQPL
jgi:hypothetical protein